MKERTLWKLLAIFGILCLGLVYTSRTKAQSGQVVYFGSVAGTTLTNCGTPTQPTLCIVATGVYAWQNSTQGWFLLGPTGSAGVTSWNGQTGAVTYVPAAPPVTSVNGKTGAVVLGATTTLQ